MKSKKEDKDIYYYSSTNSRDETIFYVLFPWNKFTHKYKTDEAGFKDLCKIWEESGYTIHNAT